MFSTQITVPLVPSEKINDGGSLIYRPYANFVNIFDVNHANLIHRISLVEEIQQVTDAMAISAAGDAIYLITSAGLTIIDLGQAPLSIGSVSPSSGSGGTQVTIRGSGFQHATTVSANGTPASTTFVDTNTLRVTLPAGVSGSIQITVSNPGTTSYTLENAYVAQ